MPVHRPTASVRGRTLLRQPRSSAVPIDPAPPVAKKTGTMNGSSATQPMRRIPRQ
ncbi:hypothetical protein K435DRAFT_787332 [Dendrothele bispora CBS 962.96]|uniref:Uncharacterized protein n=1 Tax=Dendrothele bispora (strain CBS 962.96) TaxID=1314807 RepID=A0A4S8KL52_DENBC|nr:hypothetical protein K435DRAFT_787332 [Dendrothele bispora CBS 962.96]